MSFLGLWDRSDKSSLFLIFDIGSASVSGALVQLMQNNAPLILFSIEREMHLPLKKEISGKQLTESLKNALHSVAYELAHKGIVAVHNKNSRLGAPEKAFIVFSAPWYASQIRTISFSDTKPFRITTELVENLIEKEVSGFIKAQKNLASPEHNTHIMEKIATSVKVNGYAVERPYGLECTSLEITLYVSLAPREVIDLADNSIRKNFHMHSIEYHSFSFALYDVISDIWYNEKKYFLIDISGEVTEISFILDRQIKEIITFPVGSSMLIRKFASLSKSSYAEALSLLSMYSADKVSPSVRKRIEKTLEELRTEWLYHTQNAFDELTGGIFLPPAIFLTADEPLLGWFVKTLEDKNFSLLTVAKKPLAVNPVSPKALSVFVKRDPLLPKNIFLDVDAIFVRKLAFAHTFDKSS